jgi:hypothetical protein
MMEERGHDFGRIVPARSRGLLWPCDHDNGQPEMAGRVELGERCLAAAVPCHKHIDRFFTQKLSLCFNHKRATPVDYAVPGQVWRKRERLNRANKIEMLRRRREGPEFQATDRQKNAPRFTVDRGGGGGHIGDINPMIARLRNPRRARQNDERDIRPRGRNRRMARYFFSERMRGVHKDIDSLGFKVGFKSVRATKPTCPIGNFWRTKRRGATGERHHGRNAALSRKKVREFARLKCPAKNENPHRSFPELLLSPP